MNQEGGFREKNGDIACLRLKKQRFFSTFCLQIVTIFSTNPDEYTAFLKFFPFGSPPTRLFPPGLVLVGLTLMYMLYKHTQTI